MTTLRELLKTKVTFNKEVDQGILQFKAFNGYDPLVKRLISENCFSMTGSLNQMYREKGIPKIISVLRSKENGSIMGSCNFICETSLMNDTYFKEKLGIIGFFTKPEYREKGICSLLTSFHHEMIKSIHDFSGWSFKCQDRMVPFASKIFKDNEIESVSSTDRSFISMVPYLKNTKHPYSVEFKKLKFFDLIR